VKSSSFDDFVKAVEGYYLKLKGEGIMLSPKEYDLIVNWRARAVPKEIVIMGIRRAFEKGFTDEYDRKRNFRSLTQCAAYVEELIREYKSSHQSDQGEAGYGNKDMVTLILDKLNRIIVSEKRDMVRKHYIKSRKRVLDLLKEDRSDILTVLREIEEDFFEDFFQSLSEGDRKKIMQEAESNIGKRERFMIKRAQLESLISFRNELLINEFQLINFNAMDY
jgi:hypothetical protein